MIVADARLRSELALCHGWGIPHSRFLSWPELDQDKALAYHAYDLTVCKGCGTREAEWDPASGGDRFAYEAAECSCPGCQVRGDLERRLRDSGVEVSGRYVVLLPRAEAERRRELAAERRARRETAGV
jgi:hypothetical protein